MTAPTAPKPITKDILDEGDSEAFIPYAPIGEDLEHIPIHVRPELHYYISRMGFLPNTLKLYMHVPWAAEWLYKLNNAIMRDERNGLDEHFKYRLSLIASRDNECEYCTAHHVVTLKRRWGEADDDVQKTLRFEDAADEREEAAYAFVHQASLDPAGVTDEMRAELARHYNPQEVMEIVLVMGFWKMYNTMHTAMAAPLEEPVKDYADWINIQPSVSFG